MQTTLFILMITVFLSYTLFIGLKYGIQKSISDSYYRLPERFKFLFTLFTWGFAIPAIILGNNVLMFLAGSGIVFVGAAAAFKDKMTYEVHMIGAYSGVLLSQLAIYFNYHLWGLNLLFIVPSLLFLGFNIKNKIWWIECMAFFVICLALYLQM